VSEAFLNIGDFFIDARKKTEKAAFGEVQQGTALPQRCVSMPRIDGELATDCVVSKTH